MKYTRTSFQYCLCPPASCASAVHRRRIEKMSRRTSHMLIFHRSSWIALHSCASIFGLFGLFARCAQMLSIGFKSGYFGGKNMYVLCHEPVQPDSGYVRAMTGYIVVHKWHIFSDMTIKNGTRDSWSECFSHIFSGRHIPIESDYFIFFPSALNATFLTIRINDGNVHIFLKYLFQESFMSTTTVFHQKKLYFTTAAGFIFYTELPMSVLLPCGDRKGFVFKQDVCF